MPRDGQRNMTGIARKYQRAAENVQRFNAWLKREYRGARRNPTGKRVVFTMGLPASGKSTLVMERYGDRAGWVIIDPDAISETLPGYDPKSPSLVHEKANDIAEGMYQDALRSGVNVVLDTTGTKVSKLVGRINNAKEHGYSTSLLYVTVPLEVSLERNRLRPRVVPENVIIQKALEIGDSFARVVPHVGSVQVVDTSRRAIGSDVGFTPNPSLSAVPLAKEFKRYQTETKLVRSRAYREDEAPFIRSPEDAVNFVVSALSKMKDSERERMVAVFLDTRRRVSGIQQTAIGGRDSARVFIDTIARGALVSGASGVILVHNHPSGDPDPSQEDRLLTLGVEQALRPFEIVLLDHVIIGLHGWESLVLKKHGKLNMNPSYEIPEQKGMTLRDGKEGTTGQITKDEVVELVNLYHLARTALSGKDDSRHQRMIWAARMFHKHNRPDVPEIRAYKALDRALHQDNPEAGRAANCRTCGKRITGAYSPGDYRCSGCQGRVKVV